MTTETPAQEAEQTTQPTAQAAEVGPDGQPFDAARAQALIEKLRAEAKDLKARAKLADDLQAEKAKRDEAEMTELQKAQKRLAELEAEVTASKRRELQRATAEKYKLPAAIADLLPGDTAEQMEAKAKELAETLPKPQTIQSPTNPGNGSQGITDAQRRAFLYGGSPMPK